ncbi:hypothetical protein FRB94_000401 [Tulasnella sp. JGI-2019a]|nr:hypothetical protein FRB94_000401 [Tulasnella sp. JGI-2019a]
MADDDRAAKAARAKALLKSHQKKKKVGAPVPSNLSQLAGSSEGPRSVESASVLFSPPGSEAPLPDDRSDFGWIAGDATPPASIKAVPALAIPSSPASPRPTLSVSPVPITSPPPPTKNGLSPSPITRPILVPSPLSASTPATARIQPPVESRPKEPAVDVTALQSSLQNQQQTISFLVEEKASLTATLEHLEGVEQRSHEAERLLEESRALNGNLNERVAKLERECAEAQRISTDLCETSTQMSDRAQNAERELEVTKRGAADLKTQLSQQRARVRQLEEQIEQDDRVEQMEKSMKGVQDRAESLEFQLSKLKQTHGKIKSERDDFEQQLAAHTETEGQWKSKHDKLSSDHEKTLSALSDITAERDKVLADHTSLKSQHSTTQQSLSSLQSQTSQLANQFSISSRQLSSVQSEIATANKRLEEAQDTVKSLQKENVDLLDGLNEMRPRIIELQGDKVELADKIADLESELRKRDNVIGDLEAQLDEMNGRVEELEQEHGNLDSQHARERARLEELTEEQQRAYTSLEAELSESKAVIQGLTTERMTARHAANQLQDELDKLQARDKDMAHEMQALKSELDERASSGKEVTEMMGRLREEVESLRTELSLEEEELSHVKAQLDEANLLIQAANSAAASPVVAHNPSLNEELTDALKQQHALEISQAQSQIRTLETSVFEEQAKTHTLQRRITTLEDEVHSLNIQLTASTSAAATQRLGSPKPNGGSRGPTYANLKQAHRPSTTPRTSSSSSSRQHQDTLSIVPPHPAIDSALSPEARHKRKVSLSMLKARIESEMGMRRVPLATAPNGHHHQAMHALNEEDEIEASPQQRRKAMAMLSRPQFGDESHVFCCASCSGDLVVL